LGKYEKVNKLIDDLKGNEEFRSPSLPSPVSRAYKQMELAVKRLPEIQKTKTARRKK